MLQLVDLIPLPKHFKLRDDFTEGVASLPTSEVSFWGLGRNTEDDKVRSCL